MGDKNTDEEIDIFEDGWENKIIRKVLVEIGDEEALRIFDEEQEEMERRAQEEIAEMERQGMFLPDDE